MRAVAATSLSSPRDAGLQKGRGPKWSLLIASSVAMLIKTRFIQPREGGARIGAEERVVQAEPAEQATENEGWPSVESCQSDLPASATPWRWCC